MLAFNSSMRSLTGMWKSSSGVRSASSMPAWWMAASFCCCWTSWVTSRTVTIRCRGGAVDLPHRGRMDLEVAVVLAPQRGTGALAGGQGGVEGAEIGPEDFRAAQGGEEIHAHHRLPAAPLADPPVAPEDRVVAFQQDDAVGHAFEDLLVLQQLADLEDFAEELGGRRRRRRISPASTGASARTGFWTITVSCDSAVPGQHRSHVFAGIGNQQDLRLIHQGCHTPAIARMLPLRRATARAPDCRRGPGIDSPRLCYSRIIRGLFRSNNHIAPAAIPCCIGLAQSAD